MRCIPVHLQVSSDTKFMSKLLDASHWSKQMKQPSEIDSADSDMNCNKIVKESDTEQIEEGAYNEFSDMSGNDPDTQIAQQMINTQTLT